jgi:hypothetical protein
MMTMRAIVATLPGWSHCGGDHYPHHYAFTSRPIGDRLLTKTDPDPRTFVQAAQQLAPGVPVTVISPGQRVMPA